MIRHVGPRDSSRQRVWQRLRYLRNWELANVALIPALVALMWRSSGDPASSWRLRALGVMYVSYVLLQGGVYWHLKLRVMGSMRAEMPAWFVPVFTSVRRTNPWLIAGAGCYIVLGTRASPLADRAWALAILGFAYLEHVNYFVRQLMHDTDADVAYLRRFRRLRHAPLRRDLDAAREAASARRR